MTAQQESAGLLAQILASVQGVAADVSELKVSNAAVIADAKHRADQADDHERRLRGLEALQRTVVTQATLDRLEAERAEAAVTAAARADKRANWRLGLASFALGCVVLIVNVVVTVVH